MKVLIACEESQTVCKAFRERGHEAYSCDIQEPSGGHPEWHILGDALKAIEGGQVTTMDGQVHDVGRWDLLIAHPPCTDLAASGARWFPEKQRTFAQQKSIVFFMRLALAPVDKIATENPVGIMSTVYMIPDQIVQPWMFGHPEQKATCLWLKGLPKLVPTKNVREEMLRLPQRLREKNHWCSPGPDRARIRSKTYPGIAAAMADQWGGLPCE
jgi:hypothetical protein